MVLRISRRLRAALWTVLRCKETKKASSVVLPFPGRSSTKSSGIVYVFFLARKQRERPFFFCRPARKFCQRFPNRCAAVLHFCGAFRKGCGRFPLFCKAFCKGCASVRKCCEAVLHVCERSRKSVASVPKSEEQRGKRWEGSGKTGGRLLSRRVCQAGNFVL